jgi:hypothetical protein
MPVTSVKILVADPHHHDLPARPKLFVETFVVVVVMCSFECCNKSSETTANSTTRIAVAL